jgi:hypothetical protein
MIDLQEILRQAPEVLEAIAEVRGVASVEWVGLTN